MLVVVPVIAAAPPAPGAGPVPGGVALPFSCNIPAGTATQTIRDPVPLSATEISFFDVGTGAPARSLWVNPTLDLLRQSHAFLENH